MKTKLILKKTKTTPFSIEEIVEDSLISKQTIALKMGISLQWLYKLLAHPDKMTIEQLEVLLGILKYEMEIQLIDNQ